MTLIAAVIDRQSGEIGLFADAAWTRDGKTETSFSLPLSGRPDDTADFSFLSLRRKVFRPHEDLVLMVAGPYIAAHRIARYVEFNSEKIIRGESGYSLDEIANLVLEVEERDFCSFILVTCAHTHGVGRAVCYESYNCVEVEDDEYKIISSGSGLPYLGEWDGATVLSDRLRETVSLPRHQIRIIQLLLKCLTGELADKFFHYFRFGGWYELFSVSSRGIEWLRYSLNLFAVNEGGGLDFSARFSTVEKLDGFCLVYLRADRFFTSMEDALHFWQVDGLVSAPNSKDGWEVGGAKAIGVSPDFVVNLLLEPKPWTNVVAITPFDLFVSVDGTPNGPFRFDYEKFQSLAEALWSLRRVVLDQ